MQERHNNRELYFREQAYTTRKHVIPYIDPVKKVTPGLRVLEIGCGEAGNLLPFLDAGCTAVGVDLNEKQIGWGRRFFEDHPRRDHLHLIPADIYSTSPESLGTFDLIILRDVIEHIPDQARFLAHMKGFLAPGGVAFFGFPPRRMPFGGHQQGCRSRFLSNLPYLHLSPKPLFIGILRILRESSGTIAGQPAVRSTGISIARFEKIVASQGYRFLKKTHYLINPNYEIRFKLRPRKVWARLQIPLLRDFYTTALYSVVGSCSPASPPK